MAEIGMYYFDPSKSFPAVVIKSLDATRVLVRVWTDGGDLQFAATRSDSPGTNVFVTNS